MKDLFSIAIFIMTSRFGLVQAGFLFFRQGQRPAGHYVASNHLVLGAAAARHGNGVAMAWDDARSTRPNQRQQRQLAERHFSSALFMSSVDEDEAVDTTSKTIDSTWNLPGLKKEVQRAVARSHKKVGKATQRFKQAQEVVEQLATDPNASLQDLENCPNVEAMEMDLNELKERLQGLNQLEQALGAVKGKSGVVLPPDVAQLALDLGVDDQPPARPERGPPKKKGPRRMGARLPYRRYYTVNKVEIRVGKQAADNDELSLSPQHRDGSDWWMHASGCPGSHVVIKCSDQNLPDDVVQDAAALAARQSKCQGQVIKVSLTRCRDVKKPPGAKAGLVQLVGNVRTVTVNMKEAQARLDRLDQTVEIN